MEPEMTEDQKRYQTYLEKKVADGELTREEARGIWIRCYE